MKEDKERPPVVYDLDSRVAALQEEEAERKVRICDHLAVRLIHNIRDDRRHSSRLFSSFSHSLVHSTPLPLGFQRQKREQKKQRKQENGHDAEPPVDEDMAAIMGFGNFGTTSQKS